MKRKKSKARRKQLKRIYQGLTLRQIKYRRNRLLGMNRYDAGRAAGYSESYMRTQSKRVEDVVKASIIDELNRAGATEKVMAQQLAEIALTATKLQSCTLLVQQDENGKLKINRSSDDFIEIPDKFLRIKTWELIAKLKKQLSDQPIIDQSEHTHLTLIVEKDPDAKEDNVPLDSETRVSLAVTNES